MSKKPDFVKLQADLEAARAAHEEAERAEAEARRQECIARNRLSDAMKAFDRAVDELRDANVKRDTPWQKKLPGMHAA